LVLVALLVQVLLPMVLMEVIPYFHPLHLLVADTERALVALF
jgi:hypothetical protein